MGGFAADVSPFCNTNKKQITITPDGVLFLARYGKFCRTRKVDIMDKSKGDKLSKGLAIIQVLWVLGQVVHRKVSGYPVTLLEIHTLVHAGCAVMMYILWFKKPLDVRAPTIFDFQDTEDVLAFMVE